MTPAGREAASAATAAVHGPDIGPWVERIRTHLARTVEGIVGAGRELTAAKEALPHGRFGPLLDELGLSPEMARRFMRVAANPAIANRSPETGLPSSVTVLDVLARLTEDELTEAIDTGEVASTTTRREAEEAVRDRRMAELVEPDPTNVDEPDTIDEPERRRIELELETLRRHLSRTERDLGVSTSALLELIPDVDEVRLDYENLNVLRLELGRVVVRTLSLDQRDELAAEALAYGFGWSQP